MYYIYMHSEIKFKDELKNWLVDARDEVRIEEIIFKKKSQLDSIKKQRNYHGYKFEFEMWNFFLSLKPNFISNINKSAVLNLENHIPKNAPKVDGETIEAYKQRPENDIIVVFDRHIFVIECKSTKKNKKYAELKEQTKDVNGLRSFKDARLETVFGENKYVPIHMICPNGYDLTKEDHIDCHSKKKIILFSERYRSYIETVRDTSDSPEFAYLQLLGFFRKNKPDYGKQSFSAFHSTSGKNKKHKVYTFSISPEEMLKISTVSHQAKNLIFEDEPRTNDYYQRLLGKGRIASISSWLEENNNPFPNNILVSYKGKSKLVWEPGINEKEVSQSMANVPGTLKLDACPGTFHVIDGQHRLFSYTGVEKKPKGIRQTHRLIVTAFEGMDAYEEADMFLEVNQNAKPISPGLILEIEYGTKKVFDSNFASAILFKLRDEKNSCLFKKINTAEGRGGMATKNCHGYIKDMGTLGGKNDFNMSYFWPGNGGRTWENLEYASEAAYEHINALLKVIQDELPDLWFKPKNIEIKNNQRGILQDIIFGGIIGVIDRITHHEINNKPKTNKELTTNCKKAMRKLVNGFKSEDKLDFQEKTINASYYKTSAKGKTEATAYFVHKYLSIHEEYKTLKYKDDDVILKNIADPTRTKEMMELWEAHQKGLIVKVDQAPKKIKSQSTRPKNEKAQIYHATMQIITEATFSIKQHLNGDPWYSLIVPAGLDKDNKTGFPLDYKLWKKDVEKGGPNIGYSPYSKVEGEEIAFLLSNPQFIRKAVPGGHADKDTRINKTISFIWNNLIILPKKQNKPIRPPADDDPLWKKGVEYIKLFYEFRSYSTGEDKRDPHFVKGQNTLEQVYGAEFETFDYYETEFKKMVVAIKDELELANRDVEDVTNA